MVKDKSLKKNMIMNIILTTSNFVFPLITYTYVARILGTTGTGKVAFVSSIIQYFTYIAMLGIPTYGLRECVKVRNDKNKLSTVVQELLIINIISTIISYILLFVAVILVPKLNNYKTIFIVMSISIMLNAIGLEWVYKALEEYAYITVRSIIFKILSVILTFLLIRSSEDYLWYGFLQVFATSANYVCNLLNIRKYINFKKVDSYRFARHIKPIFIMFIATTVITFYSSFDITMLGFISNDHEIGLYNAALKIKNIIMSLSTAITFVFIPRMTYYIEQKNNNEVKLLIIKSLRVSLLLALPVAIFCFAFSDIILIFLCGRSFLGASSTLKVLMVCVLPLILTNLFGNQLLIPLGRERIYSQSIFIGMCINIVLNMFLIPHLKAYGAALATLVSECWNVFWMSKGTKEYKNLIIKEIKYLQYILPVIISVIISILTNLIVNSMPIILKLLILGSVYFGVYFVFLVIFKEPISIKYFNFMLQKIKRILK